MRFDVWHTACSRMPTEETAWKSRFKAKALCCFLGLGPRRCETSPPVAMKQVSTTKYLIIMQYPFMTVSWIMNASVYKLHFEVWLCTKQHGFGNGVNQDSPRYPKIRPGSLRESSRKPSRHHLCSQKDLFQPVHWSRRWSPVSRGGGSPANDDGILSIWGYRVQWCVYFVCIYMCVCISIYIIQYVYLM